jgi:hypothetical protein
MFSNSLGGGFFEGRLNLAIDKSFFVSHVVQKVHEPGLVLKHLEAHVQPLRLIWASCSARCDPTHCAVVVLFGLRVDSAIDRSSFISYEIHNPLEWSFVRQQLTRRLKVGCCELQMLKNGDPCVRDKKDGQKVMHLNSGKRCLTGMPESRQVHRRGRCEPTRHLQLCLHLPL